LHPQQHKMMAAKQQPQRFTRPEEPAKNPRRVRHGIRLSSTERASSSWAGQRWMRIVELGAPGEAQQEGLEYTKLGQTRRFETKAGEIKALIQGRMTRAYQTTLKIQTYDTTEWDKVVAACVEQALFSAKLLSGQLPPSIEELFAPLGLKLFPSEPAEVTPSCTCADAKAMAEKGEAQWCKHACCATILLSDKVAEDPWLMFSLRGLAQEELLERLKHHRALSNTGGESAPVYSPHVEALETLAASPLEEVLEQFWDVGHDLADLSLTIDKPEVSHPLLRRLGASPFEGAGGAFPIVGLLATCYDLISERTLQEPQEEDEPELGDPDGEGLGA